MSPLRPEDFPAFFRAVNEDRDPFPWQERLAREVFQNGWRQPLDLPTASGKTAVLDIAVFHLALEAQAAERKAPIRIAFLVDRRLIVDQAEERAKNIRRLLKNGTGVVKQVADALKSISRTDEALIVRALRGGLPRESDWARTPLQPTILLSTVDQVGSRLLFRGYGVSKSMRPIHAGLLGSDCVIFLDEAHLSEPFRQSLEWIAHYRAKGRPHGPWGFVTLSATPGKTDSEPFRLEDTDREHPVLGPRLKASKRAELREISAEDRAKTYASAARELQEYEGIRRVLVVVNRVDLARSVFEELGAEGNAVLLTGRVREFDREIVVKKLDERFNSGEPFFAVATQCIEAGVDRDFDGLVTQLAPIDALRQRFGRLNRTGRSIDAKAIILATREETKKSDVIYGDASKDTWKALEEIAVLEKKKRFIDFGVLALPEKLDRPTDKPDAPVMPPAYVDLWACTNPPPSVEPEVALFLHGAERAGADVEIAWRADLTQSTLEQRARMVELVPPRAAEMMAVPVWKVRRWLCGNPAADVTDLEGEPESDSREPARGREALLWRDGEAKRIWPHQIAPGDVIVVPSEYGGSDAWGWTGRAEKHVVDIAFDVAAKLRRGDIAIRLHRNVLSDDLWAQVRPLIETQYNDARELWSQLKSIEDPLLNKELAAMRPSTIDAVFYDPDDPLQGVILTARRSKTSDASTEDDSSGSFGTEVELKDHTRHVLEKTIEFSAGLPDPIRRALELAARLHDSGKADGRFQSWLSDGASLGKILAKSGRRLSKPATLPKYWRHEALSVRLAITDPEFHSADLEVQELALWLIGTHHGWGRPFFPHDDEMDDRSRTVDGTELPASPGPQRLDFDWNGLDWASLFDRLQTRYGPWELARCEAILRLADHRASEEEEEQDAEGTSAAGAGA